MELIVSLGIMALLIVGAILFGKYSDRKRIENEKQEVLRLARERDIREGRTSARRRVST